MGCPACRAGLINGYFGSRFVSAERKHERLDAFLRAAGEAQLPQHACRVYFAPVLQKCAQRRFVFAPKTMQSCGKQFLLGRTSF
jgi:hypothetical protein